MPLPSRGFFSDPSRRLSGWLVVLLLAAVLWTFREIPGFGYALLMDDDTNIVFNPHLGVIDPPRLQWMFTDVRYVARYLPLGWLSFSGIGALSDFSPAGIHLGGICFHLLNSLLVLLCLRRLVWKFAPAASETEKTLAAGAVTLLWALHPLRVEAVAWCSGLLYTQGNFFALAAIYARLRQLEARARGAAGQTLWVVVALGAFVLSLLTYPVALFLPVLIVLLDFAWRRAEGPPEKFSVATLLKWEVLTMGALSGLAVYVTISARYVMLSDGVAPASLAEFGVGARGLQAAYVWASYIWRTVWPVNLTPVMEALFAIRLADPRIWAPLPALIVITGVAWRFRRELPFLAVGWIGYLLWMVPSLGLTEHPHTAADRYSYLGAAIFSAVLALGILRAPGRAVRFTLFAGCGILAAACAFLSLRQARIWRDPFATHRYVMGQLKDEELKKITLIRMAKLRFLQGEVRDGRAAAQKIFEEAPHIEGVARTWREIAPLRPLTPAVMAQPLQEWTMAPLAWLHHKIARDLLAAGRMRDALSHFNRAVAQAPDAGEVRFRRALLLATLGEPRVALRDWLFLETRPAGEAFPADALRFAAGQISAAWTAAGEERLAQAMRRRAGDGAGNFSSPANPLPP